VTTLLILLASVSLATAGQLMLKVGMTRVGRIGGDTEILPLVLKAITTWQVPVGLGLFALSALFWLVTLSRVPLSTAYPVVSLSYVLILLFSVVVLDERPGGIVWVGAVLIMGGIALVGLGQR